MILINDCTIQRELDARALWLCWRCWKWRTTAWQVVPTTGCLQH